MRRKRLGASETVKYIAFALLGLAIATLIIFATTDIVQGTTEKAEKSQEASWGGLGDILGDLTSSSSNGESGTKCETDENGYCFDGSVSAKNQQCVEEGGTVDSADDLCDDETLDTCCKDPS